MSVTLLHAPTPRLTDREKARRNEDAARTLIDTYSLPCAQVMGLPSAAHVTVTALDDLYEWQERRGGRIEHGTPVAGVAAWVLHTETDPVRGHTVSVHVSTLVITEPGTGTALAVAA